ncbi:MAG: hypothetical protein NW223_22165 [Hyphomicrobiaceae bacterium]|nr:hypothetical protein [Hyphomicrobiaceae bacterium]
MRRLALACTVLAPVCQGAWAATACPASSPAQLDAVVRAIAGAPGCGAAYQMMEACAFGSSADVQTGAAVVERCAPGIPPRLRSAFEREQSACHARYERLDGTMYRSMAAFCVAKAAVRFNAQGAPAR